MKIEKLSPGMIVYDARMQRMGNTTLRSLCVWQVKIISVDVLGGTVEARWNHNEVRKYWENDIKRWAVSEPVRIKNGLGQYRRATRAELKAMQP